MGSDDDVQDTGNHDVEQVEAKRRRVAAALDAAERNGRQIGADLLLLLGLDPAAPGRQSPAPG